MNLTIYAKAAYDKKQIMHKMELGADGIELYTGSPLEDVFFYDDNFDMLPFELLEQIKIVHMPLKLKKEESNNFGIDTLIGQNTIMALSKKINKLQKIVEHKIDIVCYIERDKSYLENQPATLAGSSILFLCNSVNNNNLWNEMIIFFKKLSASYPNITYYIENSTFEVINKPDTYLDFVNEVGCNNVKACVDICHFQITNYYKSLIFNKHNNICIVEYLKIHQKNIGLLHLSTASADEKGFGRGKGHSDNFDTNLSLLKSVVSYIKNNNIKIPIVLELREDDYLNCENYKKVKKQIEQILKI